MPRVQAVAEKEEDSVPISQMGKCTQESRGGGVWGQSSLGGPGCPRLPLEQAPAPNTCQLCGGAEEAAVRKTGPWGGL